MSIDTFKITESTQDWMKEINLKVYNVRKYRNKIEKRKLKIKRIYE